MISILKILVLIASVLQVTYAYCVYNRLTNSTSLPTFINVSEIGIIRAGEQKFRTTLVGYDSRACCPYTQKTCNPYGSLVQIITFNVEASFNGKSIDAKHTAPCDAGAGLAFYGATPDDFYAECVSRNGTVRRVNLDHFYS
ncbi:uncharacterized protein EV154DRAFT_483786 [Mucor mucedo]|uniref:uncharacterized protein n=1 Tax=Mucor mucedo TaxID=29922 RepID=UPI00221FF638|nr:uncharacterized protein EV154DRAFT_483786 [Mucor mucedo]KAI7888721.1 hypothetical protein EV154DRAFT_483786 [Mucor mucedo]